MNLYEVVEEVKRGLRIIRGDGEPRVVKPDGCPFDIRLHPRIIEVIEKAQDPEGTEYRLVTASIDSAPGLLLLKPQVSDREQQAFVYIGTAGGHGGSAWLTANVLAENMDRGRVSKRPGAFPSMGVQAFCDDETLARVRNGVEILDVLLLLNPGSNPCVRRDGELEGAPEVLSIRWSPWPKPRLTIDHQTKQPQARATPAAVALAPAAE